jgi:hypothetical protein
VYWRPFRRHSLWAVGADHGWLIERNELLDHDNEQVLTYLFLEAPLLCPTYATAARLCQACYPEPPAEEYLLGWCKLR